MDRTRKVELNAKMVNLTAALVKANLYIYNATNKAAVVSFIQTNNVLNPLVSESMTRGRLIDGFASDGSSSKCGTLPSDRPHQVAAGYYCGAWSSCPSFGELLRTMRDVLDLNTTVI